MKFLLGSFLVVSFAFSSAVAQKGVDTQTQTIKEGGTNTGVSTKGVSRSIDFGKGKTKTREMLANPYRIAGRRDALVETVKDYLETNKLLIDDAASRPKDGFFVTLPYVFAKGAVITKGELLKFAIIETEESNWNRGQYTFTIEIQPIDGVYNNVSVNAKIEGRAGNGIYSEWLTLKSTGVAEDRLLAGLISAVTGTPVDPDNSVE